MSKNDESCVMPDQAKDHDQKVKTILITLSVGMVITAGLYKLDEPTFLWAATGVATWVTFGILMARCPSCRKGVCKIPTHQK